MWQMNHTPPEEWVAATSLNRQLVNLGERRFAVAKAFKVRRRNDDKGESAGGLFSNKEDVVEQEQDEFLVLTGVELVHDNGSSGGDSNLLQGVQNAQAQIPWLHVCQQYHTTGHRSSCPELAQVVRLNNPEI
jgi:hypothetical protein